MALHYPGRTLYAPALTSILHKSSLALCAVHFVNRLHAGVAVDRLSGISSVIDGHHGQPHDRGIGAKGLIQIVVVLLDSNIIENSEKPI